MTPSRRRHLQRGLQQSGLTLIELLVAITLSLFVTTGLLFLFVSMNRDLKTQEQLAQLQESERNVRNVLSATLQHAGYYPDPLSNAPSTAFPEGTVTWADGSSTQQLASQIIVGKANGSGPGAASDSISVRYQTSDRDGVMNCQGETHPGGTVQTYQNTFSVNDKFQLICSVNNGTPMVLAEGIERISFLYGTSIAKAGAVDTYMNAESLTSSGNWARVTTIMATVVFLDTLRSSPGAPVPLTQGTVQMIGLKGKL
jgi:type IV pilus assembly protein PilW